MLAIKSAEDFLHLYDSIPDKHKTYEIFLQPHMKCICIPKMLIHIILMK